MSKIDQALEVLTRAQEQLVSEIATCGLAGGIGRAQNYAPVLVNVSQALDIVKVLANAALSGPTAEQIRMAAVRAAKQSKSV